MVLYWEFQISYHYCENSVGPNTDYLSLGGCMEGVVQLYSSLGI